MPDYFNLNEGREKLEKSIPKFNLKFNKKLIVPTIIMLAIPLTVGLALTQTNILKFASGGPEIASVAIDPGSLRMLGGQKTNVSALAYDTNGNPVYSGVTYEWSVSSANSVINLSRTDGNLTEVTADMLGCGQLTAIARQGSTVVTKSTNAQVYTIGLPEPNCGITDDVAKYTWVTDHVSLKADDFYIIANGKKFTAENANVKVTSSSPGAPGFGNTTLELSWTENNLPMRMIFYFIKQNNDWTVEKVWTYSGSPDGGWIFYDGGFGGGTVGGVATWPELIKFNNTSNGTNKGEFYFKNLRIQAFLTQPPVEGYFIHRSITNIPPVKGFGSFYGATAILFKDGNVLSDQSGLIYDWSVDNKDQIIISPWSYCENGAIQPPCPMGRVKVSVTDLSAKGMITLSIKDFSGAEIVSTKFGVNQPAVEVNPTNPPTPTTSETPTPTDVPTPTPTLTNTPTPTFTPIPTPAPLKMTLGAAADSFVRSTNPNQNFGTTSSLELDTNPNEISYLRFNLLNLAGKTIVSAKLVLTVSDSSSKSLTLRRGKIVEWSETGLTYNNRIGFEAAIRNFNASAVNSKVELDVKNAVNLRKGGKINFGITSAGDDTAAFYSRESVSANRPKLIIEYR